MTRKLLIGMVLFLSSVFLMGCKDTTPTIDCDTDEITVDIYGEVPDFGEYCTFTDGRGNELEYSSDMVESTDLDTLTPGSYNVTLELTNDKGEAVSHTISVEVIDTRIYQSPNGFYDLSEYPEDVQLQFVAAAEQYLMDHMYGGIPIYSSGTYSLTSDRVQFPLDQSIPYIGFGADFGVLTQDDSSVIMYDGTTGNTGEYTYRMVSEYAPDTFNQYFYEYKTYMEQYMGVLYQIVPNEMTSGYQFIPALAEDYPTTTTGTENEYGIETSTTWQIPIRDDLQWSYYQDERPSYVTDDIIDASDFIDTYKIALDEQWYRMVSGPYDFIDVVLGIENTGAYTDGTASWEDVGIKQLDAYTIEFTFNMNLTQQEVIEWFSEFYITPIHTELYEHYGSLYGTRPDTIAYHGPYQIEDYIEGQVLLLQKNENYPLKDYYHYTNLSYQIADSEDFLDLYEAGRLDEIPITYVELENYWGDDNLHIIASSMVFKLNINGFGSTEKLQETFPDSTYQPEPILANESFRKALYFAIDRNFLVQNELKGGVISTGLLSESYVGNIETGIPYRISDVGQQVLSEFSPETYGYDPIYAAELFITAVEEEIANGHYQAGTEDHPTVITIDMYYFSDSDMFEGLYEALENAFEHILIDDEHYVQLDIVGTAIEYPNLYYDYVIKGEYDLAFGGLSLCTLCYTGLFDQYRTTFPEGYVLNWGHDSSVKEIEVEYTDPISGNIVIELWSLDAIAESLYHETYVYRGGTLLPPKLNIIHTTTDSVTVSIPDFDDIPFDDITYSIQYYDLDDGNYHDLSAYTEVLFIDEISTVDGMQVVINGLEPYLYSKDTTGEYIYQGDYRIVLYYPVEEDQTLTIEYPWFMTESLISIISQTITSTGITLDVELYDDVNRNITSIQVYDPDTGVQASGTIDSTDLTELKIFSLTPDTEYVIQFTLDNGALFYYQFTTLLDAN